MITLDCSKVLKFLKEMLRPKPLLFGLDIHHHDRFSCIPSRFFQSTGLPSLQSQPQIFHVLTDNSPFCGSLKKPTLPGQKKILARLFTSWMWRTHSKGIRDSAHCAFFQMRASPKRPEKILMNDKQPPSSFLHLPFPPRLPQAAGREAGGGGSVWWFC